MNKISLLGVGFTQGSEKRILEEVMEKVENSTVSFYIVTPNPEMIVAAQSDVEFRKALNNAEVALADGVGVTVGAALLGKQGISRITGVDFMESLCKQAAEKGVSIGFLGGGDGVAERTSECLKKKYPGLKVVFVASEWSESGFVNAQAVKDERVKSKEDGIISHKSPNRKQTIDLLFVAFGFPKQEFWMAKHIGKLPVKMMMGVGGAFDYLSGDVSRAPKYMRDLGLEWLFRLVSQPWRIKRQIALPKFILLVLGSMVKKLVSLKKSYF